ncbi:DUF4333 domain-containing protein [Brevibacterium otitidis]|uniref:DUF4333 domain-containing protein n=1 Tax=Brevibacterium otitidis TaxID=53364 RepID=A0ABV5X266_9MICO|nr:hypothetical protein GCM10023233_29070 [Brevibacterium otitidis]
MRITKSIIIKAATVLAGGAAALSLSACGIEISFDNPNKDDEQSTEEEQNGEEDTQQDQKQPDSSEGADGSGISNGSGSDSGAGSGGSGSSDSGSGSGSGTDTGSGGGADPIIEASKLEASIKEQAEQQSGISGITVECNDLRASRVGATTTCTMDVPGDKKYFPIAKVTSINGNYVEYKLEFPGVDF